MANSPQSGIDANECVSPDACNHDLLIVLGVVGQQVIVCTTIINNVSGDKNQG